MCKEIRNVKINVEVQHRCPECGGFVESPTGELCDVCNAMGFILEDDIEVLFTVIDKIAYVNTTPHQINGDYKGKEVIIPPCGHLLNAKPVEEFVNNKDGITIVKTKFQATEEGSIFVNNVDNPRVKRELEVDRVIIIGSNIAVNAYYRVYGLTPIKGFERVAPNKKKMDLTKFTVAERWD